MKKAEYVILRILKQKKKVSKTIPDSFTLSNFNSKRKNSHPLFYLYLDKLLNFNSQHVFRLK
jgi:hypothetical protein